MFIGSENFKKLPALDQARIYLLQKSPKQYMTGVQMEYVNQC